MKTITKTSADSRAATQTAEQPREATHDEVLAGGLPSTERDVPWLEEGPSELGDRSAAASGSRNKGRSGSGRKKKTGLFSEDEVARLEERYAGGITAVEVVELFTTRGIRLSEATFRKYVQQGLVPRSRRVGRKGKHRGSLGVYPAKTIRRINTIKQRMEEGFTIEEIQEHFLRFNDLVEGVEESLAELFDSVGEAIEGPRFDARAKRTLSTELEEARTLADELINRIGGLAETVAEPPTDRFRGSGAAGSAEELL